MINIKGTAKRNLLYQSFPAMISLIFFAFIIIDAVSLLYYTSIGSLHAISKNSAVYGALAVSLQTSFTASILAILFGLPVAYTLSLYNFPGKKYLETLLDIPLVMPPLVSGMALLIFFSADAPAGKLLTDSGLSIIFTKKGIIIAQFFVASPFFIKAAKDSISSIPKNLLLASETLGASARYTFIHVILPLIKPGIIGGFIMTWARAMAEFGATAMVAGSIPGYTETLTMSIYNRAAAGNTKDATAIAMLLMIFSFILLIIFKKLFEGRHDYSS